MRLSQFLISNVHINEDEYSYKCVFSISSNEKTMQLELIDLESDEKLNDIKKCFDLDESIENIKAYINEKVMEHAALDSSIKEGEEYQEKKTDRHLRGLDMA